MFDFTYPFDAATIIKKKKSLKRKLLERNEPRIKKKIAILGGSTTSEIINILELFLLDYGIDPVFYESEFGRYWQDAMFSSELREFSPDIVFIHTTSRNISSWPVLRDDYEKVSALLERQVSHFTSMWQKILHDLKCPVIQNNFERPQFRLLGNRDVSDYHGRTNYISRLNQKFYEYSQTNEGFFINDIDYLSASYGLEKWADPFYWYMYKYALCPHAIPDFAFSVANIVKSIYGKNKKAIAVDLDDTLWGGIVGDDGVEGLSIGQETSIGQAYSAFQSYLKELKRLGVILNVISKNEHENAIAGLNHPDGTLRPDDFVLIKANWNPKSHNLSEMAEELSLLPESFVFFDDNPAEREIIRQSLPDVAIPESGRVEHYISAIDRSGFFETTLLSADDDRRAEMYRENMERARARATFTDYHDYLLSLEMTADIRSFEPLYLPRIAQLTNKSNQFNLTARRYTEEEIRATASDGNYITLYGKLMDRFGDNGLVSVIIGRIDGDILHIELWLMSCRVIKRDMEFAMMDELVAQCRTAGIKTIMGYYYPAAKNGMVQNFYATQGFYRESEDKQGNTTWRFAIEKGYRLKNTVIGII